MTIRSIKLTAKECTCNLCGHVWLAQIAQDPETGKWATVLSVACARCKNPRWNVAKPAKKGKAR